MISVKLTDQVIHLPALIAQVESFQAGAVTTFCGNVRSQDNGKSVLSLSYEIHPTSEAMLNKIVHEVASRHTVLGIAVAHRFGKIALGESALIVVIAAVHRAEAFSACLQMVDEIKAHLPIWKHQVFADGTDEWVNCA